MQLCKTFSNRKLNWLWWGDGPDLARLKALPEAKMLFLRVVCAGTIWQSHMQVLMSLYLQAKLKRLVT